MRLVHLADLHLGFRQYQRLTPSGINQREADVAATVQRAVSQIIALAPDVLVVAGDIFHSVRPSNPAILHAFRTFSALRDQLPDTPIIMVAGNHDAPRTSETGCILRLFRELGIFVADARAELFTFPSRSLAVLAVPDIPGIDRPPLVPPEDFDHTVLVMHGGIDGVLPKHATPFGRPALEMSINELHAGEWSYIAMGHYHVYREIGPRAYYSGSIDYTSANPWGELLEQRDTGVKGKGFIEQNLATGAHRFHVVESSRPLIDLQSIDASGMSATDVDAALRKRVDTAPGGIDDRVVRATIWNIPRHQVRELDHAALREYRKRAMHFHLDTRRPEPLVRSRTGEGAPGRRATLPELLAERLRERVLPTGLDREQLVTLGMRYLQQAEDTLNATMPALDG